MQITPQAQFLRRLIAAKGWQLGEFIRAMEETGHVKPGTLSSPTVRRWYFDGPPKRGRNHRAMLAALSIAEGSEAQSILQDGEPQKLKEQANLLEWLRQAAPGTGEISLRVAEQRGIRPVLNSDPDLPRLPEGGMVQVVLGLAEPSFALIFNHSHADATLWLLSPSASAGDNSLVPYEGIAILPTPTSGALLPETAYPIGGPKGRNDIYAVLMRSPLPDTLALADLGQRPLINQEMQVLGKSLCTHEDAVTDVRRFAYFVE